MFLTRDEAELIGIPCGPDMRRLTPDERQLSEFLGRAYGFSPVFSWHRDYILMAYESIERLRGYHELYLKDRAVLARGHNVTSGPT